MIYYHYELYKDGKFRMSGRIDDYKYIKNVIKYKRRSKRYKLRVIKGELVGTCGSYRLINCETLFDNFNK